MIYDYSLCIHNSHFINSMALGVTWYVNVIAINSEVGYGVLSHVTSCLMNADSFSLLFSAQYCTQGLGKPRPDLHRGFQRKTGHPGPRPAYIWLPSRSEGREEEWEGKSKLYSKKGRSKLSLLFPKMFRAKWGWKGERVEISSAKQEKNQSHPLELSLFHAEIQGSKRRKVLWLIHGAR